MTDAEKRKAKELSDKVKALNQYFKPQLKEAIKQTPNKDLSFIGKLSGFEKEKIPIKEYESRIVLPPKFFEEEVKTKLKEIQSTLKEHDKTLDTIPTPSDVVEKIKNLKGNERIDISHIRNGENIARIASSNYNMNDQRWHGAGSSSGGSSGLSGYSGFSGQNGIANGNSFSKLNTNTTPVSNIAPTESDLITYTLPGNTLTPDGEYVEVIAWGTMANNADNKTIKMYFGGQIIFDGSPFASILINSDWEWQIRSIITRTGSGTEKFTSSFMMSPPGTYNAIPYQMDGSITVNLASNAVIKCTGISATSVNITEEGQIVNLSTGGAGTPGISGTSGLSGYSGYSGLSGYSGFSGSGISGYSGYSGLGLSGYSGFSGLSGFNGFSGFSGVSGYSGFSGVSGFSGIGTSGFSGFSGISGYSGFSGLSGYSGYSGLSGYSGFSGQNGTGGTSGFSGYSGFSGISGYSGFSGLSGYSGYSGSGLSGYSGFSGSGISGYSGYSGLGLSGYSGFSGISGYSGYSGLSGYSGYSGISGFSGFSGKSGYSGFSGFSGSAGATGTVKTWTTNNSALCEATSYANNNMTLNSNTVAHLIMINIPASITVNNITWHLSNKLANGAYEIGVFSEDGQTKYIDITTASFTVTGTYTTAVSAVTLSPNNYYIIAFPIDTAGGQFTGWATSSEVPASGKAVYCGTMTITANTMPTTFDPTALTTVNGFGYYRFDN